MSRRRKRDDPRKIVAEFLRAAIAKNDLKSADAMKAADWIAAWEEAEEAKVAAEKKRLPDGLDLSTLTNTELDDLLLRLAGPRTLRELVHGQG